MPVAASGAASPIASISAHLLGIEVGQHRHVDHIDIEVPRRIIGELAVDAQIDDPGNAIVEQRLPPGFGQLSDAVGTKDCAHHGLPRSLGGHAAEVAHVQAAIPYKGAARGVRFLRHRHVESPVVVSWKSCASYGECRGTLAPSGEVSSPTCECFGPIGSNGAHRVVTVGLALFVACSSPPAGDHQGPGSPLTPLTAASRAGAAAPCGTTTATEWRHVVWIIMENKSYDEIVGNPDAPYQNSLAKECGLASAYRAVAHPSLPNYIAMTSGSTYGIADDEPPSVHPLDAPSLFSQLGSDWRSFQESMPAACDRGDSGDYAVKHNPAAYFTNIRKLCNERDVPLAQPIDLSSRFTLVTPNLCHDMHDCPVSTGDRWLSSFLSQVLESDQYRGGHTAVFLTYDEDDGSANNHVATFVIAPTVPRGARSPATFTHYSLLRTTEEMLGLGKLGAAAGAASMRSAFGL